MMVNDRDLGPIIPVATATYTYNHKFDHLDIVRGYRATKHFCIAEDPVLMDCWLVIGPHGSANKGYKLAEQALELAEFLEQQPVDWSTLHDGTRELTAEIKNRLTEKSAELGGWHSRRPQ